MNDTWNDFVERTANDSACESVGPAGGLRAGRAACTAVVLLAALLAVAVGPVSAAPPATDSPGAVLYKAKCASCHGAQGEGTAQHKRRLEGDRSVAQLAEVIGKTMPEDAPGSLSADEARTVAAWIHDAFYSPIARDRLRPARIELARLTVRQHRQSLTDLIAGFRPAPPSALEPGLQAEYFAGRRMDSASSKVRRVDPQVDFDFGREAPVPDAKIEPHEFSIRWQGSLAVPDTGEYEFLVRTEHAARLFLNDPKLPLIDAWVKSGKGTEFRGTAFLLGGRTYPLRLEFSKAKQGVDDSKKLKGPPPAAPASIVLLWKRPQRPVEPIPSRHLGQASVPASFVCTTPFPPDDRSVGWERGTFVSKEWDQATTEAALETAAYVAERIGELAGVGGKDDDAVRKARTRAFAVAFAERAFRRPLTPDETATVIDRSFAAAEDHDAAVKRFVLRTLKSPRFLYRESTSGGDAWDAAARLSFCLCDSLPDAPLRDAARDGRLGTREQIETQARRLLDDPRARAKLRDFFRTWTRSDEGHDLEKDEAAFPGFDAQLAADLQTSLELFVDDVLRSEGSDFRRLFRSDAWWVNRRLARFYGIDVGDGADGPESDATFEKRTFETGRRAGVLTHPFLLAALARRDETSPIHRGVFVARSLLGVSLKTPPDAVTPFPAALHPSLSVRERVALQTQAASCATCHGIINPLGFALEQFDAVGRFRERERERPVDARGSYRTRAGRTVEFGGAGDLAEFVCTSEEAHAAFVEQLFQNLVQQPIRAYGPQALDDLRRAFVAHDFDMRRLVVEIALLAALPPTPTRP